MFNMKFSALVIVSLVCGCFGNPLKTTALLERDAREFDVLANTRALVSELITNLGESVDHAREAVDKFRSGLQEQVGLYEQKVRDDIQNLRTSVQEFAQGFLNRTSALGNDVNSCITNNLRRVEDLYSKSVDDLLSCGRNLFEDVADRITSLLRLTDNSSTFTRKTLAQLRECYNTTSSTDIIGLGRCVGGLAVQTELEAAGFFAQSAYLIGRINLSFITLPAGLQSCAGSQLLEAGRGTTGAFTDIIRCSGSVLADTFSPISDTNGSEHERDAGVSTHSRQ